MKKFVISIGLLTLIGCIGWFARTIEVSQMALTEHPVATVTLSNHTSFKIELYPEYAPNTVNNFIYLAESNFYGDTKVNRMIPNYLVQTGDPIGDGRGFPGYFIKSECSYNGIKNKLSPEKGIVAMARSEEFNTEGSQFFILLKDDWLLSGKYSFFGKVIEGLDQLEALSQQGVYVDYSPVTPITIERITIDDVGYTSSIPCIVTLDESEAY